VSSSRARSQSTRGVGIAVHGSRRSPPQLGAVPRPDGAAPGAGPGGGAAHQAVASAFVTGMHAAYLLASLALAAGAVVALLLLRPGAGAAGRPDRAVPAEVTGGEVVP